MYSQAQGNILLPIARAAISSALNIAQSADESAPWLNDNGACFVTLTQHDKLRGCIGSLLAHRPLLIDLKKNAIAAALHDGRFQPLSEEELAITDIEISLISQPQPIKFNSESDALNQLNPGSDGVILVFGSHCSTFLPQVWKQFPKPRQFITQLIRKAELPANFWNENIKLSRYVVEKFKETSHG